LAYCAVDDKTSGAPRLSGKMKIKINQDSLAYRIYNKTEIEEPFNCNYELNLKYKELMEKGGLKISAVSEYGGARIIEFIRHPFYIGTGFVPQLASEVGKPHPIVKAFLWAALANKGK
jgi:CTP synthase (UTP-ammonia lyase)